MAYRIVYTPRGFSGGPALDIDDRSVQAGNPNVMALYKEWISPGFYTGNWKFRKKLVDLALKIFDDKSGFSFLEQDRNTHLVGFNYKFLLDTLKFIATGRRSMDIHTWGDLMTQPARVGSDVVGNRNTIYQLVRELEVDLDPVTLVQEWVSQKDGAEDLMCSMHLLFGDKVVYDDTRTGITQDTGVRD